MNGKVYRDLYNTGHHHVSFILDCSLSPSIDRRARSVERARMKHSPMDEKRTTLLFCAVRAARLDFILAFPSTFHMEIQELFAVYVYFKIDSKITIYN